MNRTLRNDPTLDAMIEAEVTDALRPYEGVYPPEILDEMRHMMRIVMRTHPTAAYLLDQLRPRVTPEENGAEDMHAVNGGAQRAKRV